jgi:hypothetical protein
VKNRPKIIAAKLYKRRENNTAEGFLSGRLGGARVTIQKNPDADDRGPNGARAEYVLVFSPWTDDDEFRRD